MNTDGILGWLFIGFGLVSTLSFIMGEPNLAHPIFWAILAKQYWIHSDIKEARSL